MKELTAYVLDGQELLIRPAPLERDWMDATGERFAYRCLPLNIANAHGWEILCPTAFSAIWTGRRALDAIHIRGKGDKPVPAISHFGNGILTFHIPCLFKTPPDFDLVVTGPINRPKDAIAPLTGLVETNWSPYTFTMNWQFTRPGARVHFDAGEPFCHIFPVQRGQLEDFSPIIRNLSENPELNKEYQTWSQSRSDFNTILGDKESQASKDKWQKSYFKGLCPSGELAPEGHRNKLRLRPFQSMAKSRDEPG